MLTLAKTPDVIAVDAPKDQQQYAVVLVNEEQLDRLLRKQRAPIADPRLLNAADMYERYARLKRRFAAVMVVLIVGGGMLLAWNGPSRPLASFAPFFAAPVVPALPTGASFSVSAATPKSSEAAGDIVRRIARLGLPAFVRVMPDGRTHQVLVGPYAYLEEAEDAQRRLDALGFGRGRLFVDDGLRAIGNASVATSRSDTPGLLLIGAADRVSLVFELDAEAGRPATTRLGEASLGIDFGPSSVLRPQRLAAPDGVTLLRDVAIEEIISEDGTRRAYARLAFPPSARAAVRTGEDRMYVDLSWPQEFDNAPAPAAKPANATAAAALPGMAPAAAVEASRDDEAYDDAVRPIRLRFEEVSPFVLTSARMASPEVLAALEQTVGSMEASLAAVTAPAARKSHHERLQSAIRAARLAMSADFTGDRLAQAHEAMALYAEK